MAVDLKTIRDVVSEYANYVRNELPVRKVLLYGSYAKGTATEFSDVDVCFFIANLNDENWIDIMVRLRMISLNFNDIFISPIVFNDSDLLEDNPFITEILSTGIEIH
jgi:predicted nucleotidyltransferase